MRFFISRTSSRGEMKQQNRPCEEATREGYIEHDILVLDKTTGLPMGKNPSQVLENWYGQGTNHREIHPGVLVRDIGEQEGWFILQNNYGS